jgi:hypothetical protein
MGKQFEYASIKDTLGRDAILLPVVVQDGIYQGRAFLVPVEFFLVFTLVLGRVCRKGFETIRAKNTVSHILSNYT